jgi:uncharacterized protein
VLLSPLGRLVHDRTRTMELSGIDCQPEMYKPMASSRRWSYFAPPALYDKQLPTSWTS